MDSYMRRNRDEALSQFLFESPSRPKITSNKKDLETRQIAKAIKKSRLTNSTFERNLENATPIGRSTRKEEDTFK